MSRDKQIEEMTEIICQNTEFDTMIPECEASAKALYTAGYRKTSEVAREIFAEIEKCRVVGCYDTHCYLKDDIDELKNKYKEAGK